MLAGFIFVAEYLSEWASEYTPPQIVQMKIIGNVIRSGISVLLFMGFPLFKFRYSFNGILIDKNLFEEASLDITCAMKTSIQSPSSINSNIVNGNNKYPTLLSFLSKNKKCYEEFKAHLIDCLAIENLLFFAQGTYLYQHCFVNYHLRSFISL